MSGAPDLRGEIHDLADLLGEGPRQAPAEDGEILGEAEDLAALDLAVAGDHAVAEYLLLLHPEVGAAVRHELVDLDEAAGVEEQLDALARRQLAGGVLALDAGGAAAQHRLLVHLFELLDLFFDGHRTGSSRLDGRLTR